MTNAVKWLRDPKNTTFCGITTQQQWTDLMLWEHLLNDHPEIKTIVELGTYHGGFSCFLLCQSIARDIRFWTIEANDYPESDGPLQEFLGLSDGTVCENIFRDRPNFLDGLIQKQPRQPLLLFCDNGHKTREVAEFGPLLSRGDILAVHDWSIEINEERMPSLPNIRPMFWKECEEIGSITRFWGVI